MRMMSVHREKISKNKQHFIDRFRRDPRRWQLLFLGDADKSCLLAVLQSRGGQPGNFPFRIFQKHVQLSGTASSYNHFGPPQKYQLGTVRLAIGKIKS